MLNPKVTEGLRIKDSFAHGCTIKTFVTELAGDNQDPITGAHQREVGTVASIK
jgi:hypothetical protein